MLCTVTRPQGKMPNYSRKKRENPTLAARGSKARAVIFIYIYSNNFSHSRASVQAPAGGRWGIHLRFATVLFLAVHSLADPAQRDQRDVILAGAEEGQDVVGEGLDVLV